MKLKNGMLDTPTVFVTLSETVHFLGDYHES